MPVIDEAHFYKIGELVFQHINVNPNDIVVVWFPTNTPQQNISEAANEFAVLGKIHKCSILCAKKGIKY